MFGKYDKKTFDEIKSQHNIMVLVGNGFDIALLNKYKTGKMKGKTSSYSDFYEYIKYYNLCDEKNILFKKMTEQMSYASNWSDFELIINTLVLEGKIQQNKIEKSVDEFQNCFTRFLNDLVDADLLLKINSDVQEKKLATQSLGHFLNDLESSCDIEFPSKTNYYDLYNFVFFNFNYTALLDNYLYLDKTQFDPHYWKNADRNFQFYPECGGSSGKNPTNWSSYLLTDIIHPHGIQEIPRSILFGIDMDVYDKGRSKEKRVVKSYWAQYDIKYQSYFEEAELFIIFGISLSITDGWWLDQIFDAILSENAELLIYKYKAEKEEEVKNIFIQSCIRHRDSRKEDIELVKRRIYVVSFEHNDTYFLGLEKKE